MPKLVRSLHKTYVCGKLRTGQLCFLYFSDISDVLLIVTEDLSKLKLPAHLKRNKSHGLDGMVVWMVWWFGWYGGLGGMVVWVVCT